MMATSFTSARYLPTRSDDSRKDQIKECLRLVSFSKVTNLVTSICLINCLFFALFNAPFASLLKCLMSKKYSAFCQNLFHSHLAFRPCTRRFLSAPISSRMPYFFVSTAIQSTALFECATIRASSANSFRHPLNGFHRLIPSCPVWRAKFASETATWLTNKRWTTWQSARSEADTLGLSLITGKPSYGSQLVCLAG